LFPIAYAMARQSLLYNGIRHFLFVLPPLAALAGWGWWVALGAVRRPVPRRALAAVLALALLEPLVWIVRSHPLEYVYFNPLGGGVARLRHRYEGDYWQMSLGPFARRLDPVLADLPEGRRLAFGISLPRHVRERMTPLLRHADRLDFVQPDDPAAHLRVFAGSRCARDESLPKCFFVSRVSPRQRPFLVVEKTPRFDRELAPPKRRTRPRRATR
jgi:hypothetical protein